MPWNSACDDGRDDDALLVPEMARRASPGRCPSISTVPIAPDCAGVELVCSLHARLSRHALRPAVAQVAQPRDLALGADRRRGTPAPRRSRCGSPPGACRSPRTCGCPRPSRRGRRHQRPQRLILLPLHVEKARCRPARAATCAGSCRSSRTRGPRALKGKCANACAPSTITWMPRGRAIAHDLASPARSAR